MSYELPDKLRNLPKYDPVTEIYRVGGWMLMKAFWKCRKISKRRSWRLFPKWNLTVILILMLLNSAKSSESCLSKTELLTAGNGSDELISIIVPNFLERETVC